METVKGYLLVVEDIPDILNLLETTLQFKGYRVITARNGHEAMEHIQKERPLLVITDILMPKMDGFSFVHRLRIDPQTRKLPVIFLSATYVAPEDKAFALTIGATRFLEKPVNLSEFLPIIEELLIHPVPEVTSLPSEKEFYEGYRKRLEIKLAEKNAQIMRGESLLLNLTESEKESFTLSLHQAVNEKHDLQTLLEQINDQLAKSDTPSESDPQSPPESSTPPL
jgi:DNA-binding response OmpR family regulator